MTLSNVLNQLLKDLSQALIEGQNQVIYPFADVKQWDTDVLPTLLDHKLITSTSNAQSMMCTVCDNNCFMDILTYQMPTQTRYFIVCEDSEMQSQVGRITIAENQLKQWVISIKHVAVLLARLMNFKDATFDANAIKKESIPLGMRKAPKGHQWVSLHKQPLALDVNQVQIPLGELFFVESNKIVIDKNRIAAVLAIKQPVKTKDYQSNTGNREQRKAKTKAMYQDWQDEYESQKKSNPNKSKAWISKKIAVMEIAQGRSAETIERSLK